MKDDERYEADVLASFEKGEWHSVPNLNDEVARFESSASAALVKDKRINIRLSSRDLEDVQAKAADEGMPYQTLIASVIHKYASGRLVEVLPHTTMHSSRRTKKVSAG